MKNGKILGKINIIDLLVIIAAVAAVLGIAIRVATFSSDSTTGTVPFEFVVKVEGVREYSVQGLQKGGKIYSEKEDALVGEITNFVVEPAKYDLVMLDGERKMIERPDRFSAYVTVKANGVMRNGRYCDAVETPIGAGAEYKLCSKYVSTNGEVVSVKPIQ